MSCSLSIRNPVRPLPLQALTYGAFFVQRSLFLVDEKVNLCNSGADEKVSNGGWDLETTKSRIAGDDDYWAMQPGTATNGRKTSIRNSENDKAVQVPQTLELSWDKKHGKTHNRALVG